MTQASLSAELISPFAGLSATMPSGETAGDRIPAELESPFTAGTAAGTATGG